MKTKNDNLGTGARVRKISRSVHRELSFFFAGVIFIYAISGIMLNHKRDFNANYSIERMELALQNLPASRDGIDKQAVENILSQLPARESFTRSAQVGETSLKLFFKGGSSLEVDFSTGKAEYEKLRKRPVLYAFNRLHYNPSRWWTVFSDIFAVSLIVITLTGMVMLKGPKGITGRGGIEFIAGVLIPVLFIFFF